MENKQLTLGSLFDGSGGFPLGGLLTGQITPVWSSEIEPFAIRVTTKRLPQVKHYGDVSTISGADLPPVDIITFGSPCQDMSIAGKRDGLDGSRSSLFYEAIRIVKEMRCKTNGEKPRFIVWENVPGAFSSNKGQDFKAVLEAVIGVKEPSASVPAPEKKGWPDADYYLGDGWSVAYRVFDAQWWGVPQRRKVYCGYCQKLMKYRVFKKLGSSFNCRFSAAAVDSPCKRIPISEELLEHIVRNALTAQIKQAEHILEILHERERKALICFSALERQEEKLSAEKAELVKLRVALYEQYADGNMSKEEFIRQRDAYRVQEDERMEQIQRLRTEKNQIFQPVKKDTDSLQAVMNTVGEVGDVMHLSQNVVGTFIDRIEVFNDERVKIRFTFEDTLKSYETG